MHPFLSGARARRRLARCALATFALSTLGTPAVAPAAQDFREKMGKWVEARQVASKEKSDWDAEKETLRATRDLLRQQRDSLRAEIEELEAQGTASDDERRDLLLERGDYLRTERALEEDVRAMEQAIVALAPRLPEPLQKKLEILLVQIPDDPETTKVPLGARLMNVLGVLAQAEKFDSTATFVGETRQVGDEKLQVRTLYWGLAQAIYVDAQGRTAGIGRPGPNGWEFTNDPDLASDARHLLDIYEGNVDTIEFVRFPVEAR